MKNTKKILLKITGSNGALVSALTFSVLFLSFGMRSLTGEEANEAQSLVSVRKIDDAEIRVFVDGDFFASVRADYKGTPIVWPICGPNGSLVTRAWPMIDDVDVDAEQDPRMKEIYQNAIISERGGVKDHPHHRSLWFNHGNVLGGDFWGGTPSVIKQVGLAQVSCDQKTATIQTENKWFNDKLKRDVCRDVRSMTFGVLSLNNKKVRYLDFSIEIFALEDGVVFGDTKEGSFGIRVPSPTAVTSSKLDPQWGGAILNDEGEKDGATWGKRSLWVDYTGPAERFLRGDELEREWKKDAGSKDFPLTRIGIAVISGPNSLGTPAWRHVRDYGLFSSNPFGWRDFEPQNPNADGSRTLNKNESMTFNFRALFHEGNLTPDELNLASKDYNEGFAASKSPKQ
ncbi:MAG: PmoA family protein [Thermoguttaceae bacterium]|nr:PmoA family protein [Thermoguttaceae bacterium]